MELRGKKVLVVGFGKTGFATISFLLKQGALVTLTDRQRKRDIPKEFLGKGVVVETGGHKIETFIKQDLIVISPGVPLIIREIIEAQARGIEVISEIELAYRFLNAPLIAITGTNGKTTTTSLLGQMFRASEKKIFVGGNIGTPLIEYVAGGQQADYVIAEISSFQLEGIKNFKPYISVLLNITEDHLDRYPSFSEYVFAKSRIFENQKETDIAVLNFDDHNVKNIARQIKAQKYFFSTQKCIDRGAYYNGSFHLSCGEDKELTFSVNDAVLQGAHNRENMLAAASVGFLCKLPEEKIRRALLSFGGLPHRMEFVDEINRVNFINDSKGTNVGACIKSLESISTPVVLIAGGKDKGGSYLPLNDLVSKKVKALILIGEAKKRMHTELGSAVPTVTADSLVKAVEAAFCKAEKGDSILFSPACSSFDMFKNYEHRGECFKDLVRILKKACTTKPQYKTL
jgi:UDP-N-acetylmuramoylalanine--D-glutamate ligase